MAFPWRAGLRLIGMLEPLAWLRWLCDACWGAQDRPVELLEGLRCPIVLKLESGWWENKAFDLDRIHMHTPAKIVRQ